VVAAERLNGYQSTSPSPAPARPVENCEQE